ncbi:hypothetical protein EXIGLDRAFT_763448, partial [Exidia glandulosa HHB12029]
DEVYDSTPRSRTSSTSSDDSLPELLELRDALLPHEGLSRSQTSSTSSDDDDDDIPELEPVPDDHKLSTAQKWENFMSPKWPSLKRCMNEYAKVVLDSKHEGHSDAERAILDARDRDEAQRLLERDRAKMDELARDMWRAIENEKPADRLRDMCRALDDHQRVDEQRAKVSVGYLRDYDKAIALHVSRTKREAKQVLEDTTLSDGKRSIRIHLIHLGAAVSWPQLCTHTGRLVGWPGWGEKLEREWDRPRARL